jgi:hypothetical protein
MGTGQLSAVPRLSLCSCTIIDLSPSDVFLFDRWDFAWQIVRRHRVGLERNPTTGAAWMRMCYLTNMRTPSKIEAAGGPADTSKQQIEADSVTWKRDYKGCMVTIFGSPSAGWNVKIDKREPIILGYTRPRAIKYAKELIDEEQAKFHSRSAGGLPRKSKVSPESARHSFPTVTSADRRRG